MSLLAVACLAAIGLVAASLQFFFDTENPRTGPGATVPTVLLSPTAIPTTASDPSLPMPVPKGPFAQMPDPTKHCADARDARIHARPYEPPSPRVAPTPSARPLACPAAKSR
jgi:hypothetical protein